MKIAEKFTGSGPKAARMLAVCQDRGQTATPAGCSVWLQVLNQQFEFLKNCADLVVLALEVHDRGLVVSRP